jgi:nucleotide-binding universal stress UspA family protein
MSNIKKKILIPTLVDTPAIGALRIAHVISDATGWPVAFVNFSEHVQSPSLNTTGDSTRLDKQQTILYNIELVKKHENKLKEIVQSEEFASMNIEVAIEDRNLHDDLSDYIQEHEIGMIIMQSTGKISMEDFFKGSHTDRILEEVAIPVIVTEGEAGLGEINQVVFDLEGENYEQVLNDHLIKSLLLTNRVEVFFNLNIKDDENINTDQVMNIIKEYREMVPLQEVGLQINTEESRQTSLLKYVDEKGADLIITQKKGASGILRIFTTTKDKELVKNAPAPVLFMEEV